MVFSIVLAAILCVLFAITAHSSQFYYWALGAGLISVVVAHWFQFGKTFATSRSLRTLAPMVMLYIPMALMLLLIEGSWFILVWPALIGVVVAGCSLVLKYVTSPRQEEASTSQQFVTQLTIGIHFVSSVWLVASVIILNWPTWLVAGIFALWSVALFAITLRFYHLSWQRMAPALISLFMLALESLVIVLLWPTTMYTMAALLTIVFYVVAGLSRQYVLFGMPGFTRKVLKRYGVISLLGMIIIFITSRWG